MPLLLYAVADCGEQTLNIPMGVAAAKVEKTEVAGLACFYSASSDLSGSGTREAALAFHKVVQAIFASADVIPFRFPTWMKDEAELASQIQEHAAEYHDWLARVRGRVQMEIRIQHRDSTGDPSRKGPTVSGAEYLRGRQVRLGKLDSATAVLKAATAGLARGWRQRGSSDRVRCFALVGRESVAEFQRTLAAAEIASDLLARVSGPWPPTEFFKGDQR